MELYMNHTTEVVYNSVFHNAIRLQVNLCFLYNCLEISCRATLGLGYKATFKQVHKSVGFVSLLRRRIIVKY